MIDSEVFDAVWSWFCRPLVCVYIGLFGHSEAL